ncbi:MAG TPA: hypothetical protein VGB94_08550 [Acidobacteriaceae bacterium]
MNFLNIFLRGLTLVPTAIQTVEGIAGSVTGADKKSAVLSIVGSAISVADAVTGKTIADADAFQSGLGKVIDGVVDCLNSSVWNKAA